MKKLIALGALGIVATSLSSCYYPAPVAYAPPPEPGPYYAAPAYYAPTGYYAAPAYYGPSVYVGGRFRR